MSLLDKLKKQAKNIIEKKIEEEVPTVTEVDVFVRDQNGIILNKKLDFIHDYLKQFVENINIIKPENEITYNLNINAQTKFPIDNVRKINFSVHEGKSKNGKRIFLKYDLISKKDLSITVNKEGQLPAIRKYLMEKTIKYFEKEMNEGRTLITLDNPVSTRFIYATDLDNCMVILNLDNFDGPGSNLIRYEPQDITEELMDETAKYILGEANQFFELSGNSVSEKTILQLREHLTKFT